jgi:hypothetical protein
VTVAIKSVASLATSSVLAKNGMAALFEAPEFVETLIRVGLPLVRYRLRIFGGKAGAVISRRR